MRLMPKLYQAWDIIPPNPHQSAVIPARAEESAAGSGGRPERDAERHPAFGTSKADEPNTSQTIWRTVADLTNGVSFESTTSPNIVWVKLRGLDFSEGAKVQKA